LTKPTRQKDVWELAKAPVSAISGVSESDAKDLKKTFGIETVEDLANNRYVNLAQGINFLSACSGEILDKKFESKEFENLAEKPVSAISGILKRRCRSSQESFWSEHNQRPSREQIRGRRSSNSITNVGVSDSQSCWRSLNKTICIKSPSHPLFFASRILEN
jgi:hypothetical protein